MAAAGRLRGKKRKRFPTKQQGMAGQLLFTALVILGSRGAIKAGFQTTDDEGRDVDIHLGGVFLEEFGIQVKTALRVTKHRRRWRLTIQFNMTPGNIVNAPTFWYFLAHLDLTTMRFSDYVFLVPARVLHRHISSRRYPGRPIITIHASMDEAAHDRWTPYRLKSTELVARLVTLLREAPSRAALQPELSALKGLPGVCWLALDLGVAAHPADPAQQHDR